MATITVPELPTARVQIGPRSLHRMSLTVALREISSIFDLGDLPFELAESILDHIEDPFQLAEITQNCPQIAFEADKMNDKQLALLDKQFPRWRQKDYYPVDETMDFLEVHAFLIEAKAQEQSLAVEKLASDMAKADAARPDVEKFIHREAGERMPGKRVRAWGVSTKPASALDQIRRQVKQAQRARRSLPRTTIPDAKSQLTHAPAGMVRDHILNKRKDLAREKMSPLIIPPKKKNPDLARVDYTTDTITGLRDQMKTAWQARYGMSGSKRSASDDDDTESIRRTPAKRARTDAGCPSASPAAPALQGIAQREARLLAAKTKRPAADGEATSPETPSKRARPDGTTSTTNATTTPSPAATKTRTELSASSPSTPTVPKKSTGLLSNARGVYAKQTIRKVVEPVAVSKKTSTKGTTTPKKTDVTKTSRPTNVEKDVTSPRSPTKDGAGKNPLAWKSNIASITSKSRIPPPKPKDHMLSATKLVKVVCRDSGHKLPANDNEDCGPVAPVEGKTAAAPDRAARVAAARAAAAAGRAPVGVASRKREVRYFH